MNVFGYGVVVRTRPIDLNRTIAFQELSSIGHGQETIRIDIVRPEDSSRPELNNLINSLATGDRIDMFSVNSLLQGKNNLALDYYERILKKGIVLCIFDFTGGVAKLSDFSTFNLAGMTPTDEEIARKISAFEDYCNDTREPVNNAGSLKTKQADFTEAFKYIYFSYEGYQLDLPTTIKLLDKYCGITQTKTFFRACSNFEKSYGYATELEFFIDLHDGDLPNYPKRSGKIPDEYYRLKEEMYSNSLQYTREAESLKAAAARLGIFASYNMFRRWRLRDEGKPRLRTPVIRNFSIARMDN